MIFFIQKLDSNVLDDVLLLEMCVGGDHSKNTCSFCYYFTDQTWRHSKDAFHLELKLDENNEEKDQIKCVKEILKKINHGLDAMSTDKKKKMIAWL